MYVLCKLILALIKSTKNCLTQLLVLDLTYMDFCEDCNNIKTYLFLMSPTDRSYFTFKFVFPLETSKKVSPLTSDFKT